MIEFIDLRLFSCLSQILHGELEQSFRLATEQLEVAKADLEKQTLLAETLENDLLSLNKPKANGELSPSNSSDVLASLDLGKKGVCNF